MPVKSLTLSPAGITLDRREDPRDAPACRSRGVGQPARNGMIMVVGVVGIVMPVEFLGIGATNDGTETHARSGPAFDPEYTVALARAHEESGWDRVLTAYGSGSPDPAQAAALIACRTERLQLLLAHRPNVAYPTFTAKTVATLDQISGGRLTLHVITGGNDHEQQREGDTLPKDRRYDRTREAIQIFKRAWTERSPFDFHGEHYSFDDFVLDVEPAQKPRPKISFGGSSAAAYKVGAEEADIYALWGEPLAGTAEQIATITQLAEDGRSTGADVPGGLPADPRPHRGGGVGEGLRHGRGDPGPHEGRARRSPAATR